MTKLTRPRNPGFIREDARKPREKGLAERGKCQVR
jgi:hypothetical protein